jgi:hypothetical protein
VDSFPAEDRGEVLDPEEYAKKGYGQDDGYKAGQGSNIDAMIEIDEFEAAAKRMKIKEDAAIAKRKKKAMGKNGGVEFKEDK